MNKWTEIIKCINEYDDIVIMTHTNMDGDAMGSASALCRALRKAGKRCVILLEDKVPAYLNIIHRQEEDASALPYFADTMPYNAKLAIAVDCGEEGRIEKRIDVFRAAEKRICIDHHIPNGKFADYSVIEPDQAAAGLLVYEFIKELGTGFDTQIAEDLYVAIATDTGRFKFSNTTAYVHTVIADLYSYGIDHVKLCNAIFDTFPPVQLKAEALAVSKMQLFADGKAVISSVTFDEMQELGASYDQLDTCIDRIRVVEGTEISAFLKEKEPNVIKVSLRAKSYANVNKIAKSMGGGGHEKASGVTLNMSLEEAAELCKTEIIKELEEYK